MGRSEPSKSGRLPVRIDELPWKVAERKDPSAMKATYRAVPASLRRVLEHPVTEATQHDFLVG
jgi:hypothetical protein